MVRKAFEKMREVSSTAYSTPFSLLLDELLHGLEIILILKHHAVYFEHLCARLVRIGSRIPAKLLELNVRLAESRVKALLLLRDRAHRPGRAREHAPPEAEKHAPPPCRGWRRFRSV